MRCEPTGTAAERRSALAYTTILSGVKRYVRMSPRTRRGPPQPMNPVGCYVFLDEREIKEGVPTGEATGAGSGPELSANESRSDLVPDLVRQRQAADIVATERAVGDNAGLAEQRG